jgi:flagellar FliL protein
MAEHKKEEGGGEKKSSKKMMIIIIAVVILLAGGGGAGYYFFMRGHDSAESEGDKKKEHKGKGKEKKHEEKSSADEEEHPEAESIYYDLGKPLVVDFSKSGSVRFVSISLSLLAAGAETVDALKKNEPMIRNNLLMLINAQGVEVLKTKEGKDKLRAAILTEVAGVLEKMESKGKVKDIFFTSFVMQ